jgi:hypothetical protein
MEGEAGGPELADSTEALEGGCINELDQQGFYWIAKVQGDRAVEGVMVGAVRRGDHGLKDVLNTMLTILQGFGDRPSLKTF